jgi:hypothetical protein
VTDLEQRISSALHALAPSEPSTDGLVAGALAYHKRVLRRRLGAAALAALVVVLVVILVAAVLNPPAQPTHASPMGTASYCTSSAEPTVPPQTSPASAAPVLAAWICPDPSGRTNGDGWQLPEAALTGQHAEGLSTWAHARPGTPQSPGTAESGCGPLRPGPAFTVTLQSLSGAPATYRSSDLRCGGTYLIAAFLEELASQEADARAAASPDEALACRSGRAWTDSHHVTPSNSAFVAARLCFAPSYWVGEPDRMIQPLAARSYQSALLPSEALELFNQDMTSATPGAFYTGNGECLGEGAWIYSIVGRTASDEYRMLGAACLDEMALVGLSRVGFDLSPATTAALRALVPPR